MVYITVMQSPMYHQMTLDEFLFPTSRKNFVINNNTSNTRTYEMDHIGQKYLDKINVAHLISQLVKFNESTEELRKHDRGSLYYEFYIPKKSGGLRRIDAPLPELMDALRRLKDIFETDFHALYHTASFAYVKKRSTLDAVKRHQANESKWFAKLDLHNFFGSTTLDFVMNQFSMVFPFSEVVKERIGYSELRKALDIAFLNGVLPQGTPISPLITNIMMIPVDYKLAKGFRDLNGTSYVFTRYADDFTISSKYAFDIREIEKFIVDTLNEFHAPFTVNNKKTRYGSSAGKNWNLGVMLNKDNEITVGYQNKRRFKAMLTSYIVDKRNGIDWDLHDVQVMDGLRNYYHMVEPVTIDTIIQRINEKFNVSIIQMIRRDLKSRA